MATWTILHNPRCSKSRQTLSIVEGLTDDIEVVEYLKDPPTETWFKSVLKQYRGSPKDLVRTKEPLFKELGPDIDTIDQVAKLLAIHPQLMERPLVVKGGKAVLGRPPENVNELA